MTKKVYIKTFGCQMNEYDTLRIFSILRRMRYEKVVEPADADLILLNSCSVRQKAEQKLYSLIGRLARFKKKKKRLIIGVGGCVGQQEGSLMFNKSPYIDFVFGPHTIDKIPELLKEVEENHKKKAFILDKSDPSCLEITPFPELIEGIKAYVTIMQGCDNFCSYCIVPYVRGREVSRPSKLIIKQIKELVEKGIKEVILLGQNVNSYGLKDNNELTFPQLLYKVNNIEGLKRIRFITSHPKDLSEDLIMAFKDLEKLCEHIHLPFQSGSNRILKLMNRGYTREEYLDKIERLKELKPDISFSADVIVGFPGESEEDFSQTLDLIQRVQFDQLYSFQYSPRKGTKAALLPDEVDPQTKNKRLQILQAMQRKISIQKNIEKEGKVVEVLVEGRSKNDINELTGRTRGNKIVNFPGKIEWIGSIKKVKITKGYANSLRGVLV
ncbi:MAG: tRNA (N6-isopentenyl adenosine(37)-C2)-methylthiotransferase MiaB [Deltaproteobacteria bacterium]|nr:tRNA (N6-isopentenyl adenosine(37)-C2)-methylthiotransferase MiaB [Deltaproteobacteria bacterium]